MTTPKPKRTSRKTSDSSPAELVQVSPEKIDEGWRARQQTGDLVKLAASLKELGQLQPIVVVPAGTGRYRLVAGARRLAAARLNGQRVLARVIQPTGEAQELAAQLAENVQRQDFDTLELGRGLARLKELYQADHPETVAVTVRGGPGRGGAKEGQAERAPRFSAVAASALAVGETMVKDALQLASLPAAQLEAIEQSKTSAQRAQASQRALSEVRRQHRLDRLAARAAEAQQQANIEATASPEVRLLPGDCIEVLDGLAAKGEHVDLILTDPPYETGRVALVAHTSRSSVDGHKGAWDRLDVRWVGHAAPLLQAGGQLLAFCPLEAIGDYKVACEAAELTWRGALVWTKSDPAPAHRNVYVSGCEAIVWATRGGGYHFAPFGPGETSANVIVGPTCREARVHPTQKPLWLMRHLLQRHAPPGALVLDPFAGSGTTLIAARAHGCRALGVERDPEFLGAATLRLAADAAA